MWRKIGFRSLKMAEDRVKMRYRSRQERQDAIFDTPPTLGLYELTRLNEAELISHIESTAFCITVHCWMLYAGKALL